MGDRFDGCLAGGGRGVIPDVSVPSALHELALNESLLTKDESGDLILFHAVQNPMAGGVMFIAEPSASDSRPLLQAIKLSQMSSMLSDRARCSKYAEAISHVVKPSSDCRVLDIGTGTGLLAMLAAKAGATHVDAVEMFEPLAKLAIRIIEANDLAPAITVHPSKSTDLDVTSDKSSSIQQRANVLVTEIFDSALLGEGCLPVIAHAREHLLTPNATVIPAKASVFARVVTSQFLAKFHDLGADFPLHRSQDSRMCKGGITAIPMHIDALEEGRDYDFITDSFRVFDFDFSNEDIAPQTDRNRVLHVPRLKDGKANAVITWWILDLLGDGSVTYSTESGVENWQDHWLQMVYPLPYEKDDPGTGETISLAMSHDDATFHFALGTNVERLACSCGYHALPGGSYRISELADRARMDSLKTRINSAITKACRPVNGRGTSLRCVDVSDSGICLALASMVSLDCDVEICSTDESDELSAFVYSQVARRVKGKRAIVSTEFEPLQALVERETVYREEEKKWQPFDVFLSEPYSRSMYRYPISMLGNLMVQRRTISHLMSENFISVPSSAVIQTQLIRFADNTIQSSFSRVGSIQGFDHGEFNLLFDGFNDTDENANERISLPLFQYKTEKMSPKTCLHSIQFSQVNGRNVGRRRCARLRKFEGVSCQAEALIFWIEYDGLEASRLHRYEMVWLSKKQRESLENDAGVDVWCQWKEEEGLWKIGIDTVSGRGSMVFRGEA